MRHGAMCFGSRESGNSVSYVHGTIDDTVPNRSGSTRGLSQTLVVDKGLEERWVMHSFGLGINSVQPCTML